MRWEARIMRSKISFFNGTIFKKNFTHYWPIWVLFLIYLICQIPIRIFGTTSSIPGVTAADVILQQKTNNYFNVLSGTLQPMVCFAGGMISAMAVFHYMYFQRNAQAYHSFPVRREELFFTNYISLSFVQGLSAASSGNRPLFALCPPS